MAGRGPAPKESRQRADKTVKRESLRNDEVLGPELPDPVYLPVYYKEHAEDDVPRWHPLTVRWWENWRRSPQAVKLLTDPDWDFLLDTAVAHHVSWCTGKFDMLGELRIRVAKYGATPEDRLRLKVEIEDPREKFPAGNGAGNNVTPIDQARRDAIKSRG